MEKMKKLCELIETELSKIAEKGLQAPILILLIKW